MAGMYEGIAGGTLGGIGDIIDAMNHQNLKFPGATPQEIRQRRMTMQDLENSRNLMYSGAGMYNQTLPDMYNAIPGYSANVSYDPQAQQSFQDAYGNLQNRIQSQQNVNSLRAKMQGTQPGAAKKTARQAFRTAKKGLKGQPSLSDLNEALYSQEAGGPKMKITKKAPTQTDQNAQSIQDALSNRVNTALHGGNANPLLERQLQQQQLGMQGNMQRAMGPDWQTSSPGIEAQALQNQFANNQRDQSNRQDIASLYPEQLGGQQAGYTFGGLQQQLLSNPASGLSNMGHNLSSMVGPETQAQSPYQFDRSGNYNATMANWQYGDPYAHGLINSGNRWASIGGSGGGNQGAQPYYGGPPSSSSPYFGNQNNAQTGQNAWAIDNGGY